MSGEPIILYYASMITGSSRESFDDFRALILCAEILSAVIMMIISCNGISHYLIGFVVSSYRYFFYLLLKLSLFG
jgi:hypothetical protein